ncbi:MAG TPA: hypothetical protein VF069_08780, partial [Streptosporangiaceae bacterium]
AVMIVQGRGGPAARPPAAARPGAAEGPAPSAYSDSPSTRAFAGIDRRAADAAPLTAAEAFPKSAAVLEDRNAGVRLRQAGSRLDADCAAAVWGARLAGELRRGGCTQVARAGYLDKKAGYAALVAIINLATAADANRLVDALGNNAAPGFVLSLPGVDRFDQGFSLARGRAMGHYAVIGWVRRLDGTGDEQDEALLSLLVTVSGPAAVLNRAAATQGGAATTG